MPACESGCHFVDNWLQALRVADVEVARHVVSVLKVPQATRF